MNTEHQPDQYPQPRHVFIVLLVTMFVTFTFGLIGVAIGGKTEIFLLEAVIIVPALFFTLKNKYSLVTVFRLKPVNKNIIAISIVIGIAFTIISDEIDRIVQIFFPMPSTIQDAINENLKIHSTSDLIIIIFSAVFLAAILEEMLFRGFVQTSFEDNFDVTKAVMSTALIFTVIHFNPWWGIQMLIFGIILGVLAWKSNSVIPPIIIHLINNCIALIFSNLQPENYQWYLYKDHVNIPILIAAVVIVVYGIKLFYRLCDYSENYGSEIK